MPIDNWRKLDLGSSAEIQDEGVECDLAGQV